jgi:ribonucleoside-diphosphate reductase alpha chain
MSPVGELSEHAQLVLRERYLRRDDTGRVVETPGQMFERVAAAVAAPGGEYGDDTGRWEARFLDHLRALRFLPNSPTLMNAGLPGGQLAACFVLPVEDDLDSIFRALGQMARIHQTGGGTGFSFSRLRPRDAGVRSTGGVTSGPLSFMDLFDHTTAVIRAGGRRRGANMAVLRVDHPDIVEFVRAKRAPGRLENFNLSVAMTDEFLAALDARTSLALRNPRNGRPIREVDAEGLFEEIVESAWWSGDPGLLFVDEINRHNPAPQLGAIEATNPCGEQPLLPYESCVLGSLNLAAFAAERGVDWSRLAETAHDAVVFLDNVIDASCYPFPEIAEATRRTRKIGLGVMGLADLLARVGVPYDSEEGLRLGERIAERLAGAARDASMELAARRGSFPAFERSMWPQWGVPALRNATVSCVAPTGTISLLAGTSSGIEPRFALATERRVLDGRVLVDVDSVVLAALDETPLLRDDALEAIRASGSLRGARSLPDELRRRFPIALEIEPRVHLQMQAAFQSHADAAVSKTVNLPADAPVSVVRDVFLRARELKLKGVTVYRYGSRPGQTLSILQHGPRHDCRECAT